MNEYEYKMYQSSEIKKEINKYWICKKEVVKQTKLKNRNIYT